MPPFVSFQCAHENHRPYPVSASCKGRMARSIDPYLAACHRIIFELPGADFRSYVQYGAAPHLLDHRTRRIGYVWRGRFRKYLCLETAQDKIAGIPPTKCRAKSVHVPAEEPVFFLARGVAAAEGAASE